MYGGGKDPCIRSELSRYCMVGVVIPVLDQSCTVCMVGVRIPVLDQS